MDAFIEVVGAAELKETATEYAAQLDLTVRAAQAETAIKDATDLKNRCLRHLREAGLGEGEVTDGGADVSRSWFWKKKVGQEVTHRLLVASREAPRLYAALAALEPLFENSRFTLAVSMRRPRFAATPEDTQRARRAAIEDARSKAAVLADEAGVGLGPVCQVEELTTARSASGALGDEEWRGWAVAGAAGAVGAAGEGPDDEPPSDTARTSHLRFRVRFGLGPGPG